jgi:hypothetical protein
MIWGKTQEQRALLQEWHPCGLCLRPHLLEDGRFAWFERLERRRVYVWGRAGWIYRLEGSR